MPRHDRGANRSHDRRPPPFGLPVNRRYRSGRLVLRPTLQHWRRRVLGVSAGVRPLGHQRTRRRSVIGATAWLEQPAYARNPRSYLQALQLDSTGQPAWAPRRTEDRQQEADDDHLQQNAPGRPIRTSQTRPLALLTAQDLLHRLGLDGALRLSSKSCPAVAGHRGLAATLEQIWRNHRGTPRHSACAGGQQLSLGGWQQFSLCAAARVAQQALPAQDSGVHSARCAVRQTGRAAGSGSVRRWSGSTSRVRDPGLN